MAESVQHYRQATRETITVPVTAEQLQDFAQEMADHFKATSPQVTHKLAVGTHYLPGDWVVVSHYKDSQGKLTVTLALLED